MTWLGNCLATDLLHVLFSTQTAVGVPSTLTVTTITAYQGGDDTEFSTGLTLTPDFDGITGLNLLEIDMSGAAWETGYDYNIVLTGTVDAIAVTRVLCTLSLDNRSAPVVVGSIEADAITAATIASGAIAAGAFGTGAITPASLSAGLVSTTTLSSEIEDAVWDAATSDHSTSTGTVGYALDAIWDRTDRLGSGIITVHSPITAQGDLTVTQGDSYTDSEIVWTDSATTWPAGLSSAVVTFRTTNLTKTLTFTAGSPDTLTMPALATADTAALDAGFQSYWIEAVWTPTPPPTLPALRKTITRGVMYVLPQRTA